MSGKGLINWIGDFTKKALKEEITYEESKARAADPDPKVRAKLAERDDAPPEILYYLADDKDPSVRRQIASNYATPVQADHMLAKDEDDETRMALAEKIAKAIPNIPEDQKAHLRDMAYEILQILVEDQLPRVREILAEELKHTENVSADIIHKLATDHLYTVAAPILEYSPLLTQKDLLAIIANAPSDGRLSAVAKRKKVSEDIADALVSSDDNDAIAALLRNPGAQLREDTLDQIVRVAEYEEPLHEPLVKREDMPDKLVRRIATFVSSSLLNILSHQADLDPETAIEISMAVEKRLEEEAQTDLEAIAAEVGAHFASGQVDETYVLSAVDKKKREHAIYAMSLLSDITPPRVRKILTSRNARAVVSLCWAAGLAPRGSIKIQTLLAKIPHKDAISGDGSDYSLPDSDMELLLELFN